MAAQTINLAIPSFHPKTKPHSVVCVLASHPHMQSSSSISAQYHRRHRRSGHKLVPLLIGLTKFQGYCVRDTAHRLPTRSTALPKKKRLRSEPENKIGADLPARGTAMISSVAGVMHLTVTSHGAYGESPALSGSHPSLVTAQVRQDRLSQAGPSQSVSDRLS